MAIRRATVRTQASGSSWVRTRRPLLPGAGVGLLGGVLGHGEVAGEGVDEVHDPAGGVAVERVELRLGGLRAHRHPLSGRHRGPVGTSAPIGTTVAITPQQTRSREVGLRRVRTFLRRCSALHAGCVDAGRRRWSSDDCDGTAAWGNLVDRRRARPRRAPAGPRGRGVGGGRFGGRLRPARAARLGGRAREHRVVDQLPGGRGQPVAAGRRRAPDPRCRAPSPSSRCSPSRVSVAIGSWAAARAAREAAEARTIRLVRDAVHGPVAFALGAWTAGYAACALLWVLVAFLAGSEPGRLDARAARAGGPGPRPPRLALGRLVRGRPELAGPGLRRPAWFPDAVRRALRPGSGRRRRAARDRHGALRAPRGAPLRPGQPPPG